MRIGGVLGGPILNAYPGLDTDMLPLALIVGGAFGNLADRIRLDYVIDFLDFHWKSGWHFPAFNVADSAITLGAGLLMLDALRRPRQS